LSPQQLVSLKNESHTPNHDQIKSEVWALGLTTLCASLNKSINEFYDWNGLTVRWDNLKCAYETMRDIGYSEQLISTLQQCLEENESRRSTFQEIIDFLAPYQDQIQKGQHSFGFNQESDVLLAPKVEAPIMVHSHAPQRHSHVTHQQSYVPHQETYVQQQSSYVPQQHSYVPQHQSHEHASYNRNVEIVKSKPNGSVTYQNAHTIPSNLAHSQSYNPANQRNVSYSNSQAHGNISYTSGQQNHGKTSSYGNPLAGNIRH